MADPIEDNLETAVKMLNVQKDMTIELEKHESLLNSLSGLDTNIEKSIQKQLANATHSNEMLISGYKHLNELYEQSKTIAVNTDEAVRDRLKHLEKSRKEELFALTRQRDISKMLAEYQLAALDKIKKKHDFIYDLVSSTLGFKFKEIDAYKAVNAQLGSLFPKIKAFNAGLLSGFLILVQYARAMYDSFEKAAFEFRKYAGMFRDTAKPLRRMAEDITVQFHNVGVSIDGAYVSLKSLGTEMGGLHNITKDITITTALLSSQLGVSEENTAGMLRNLAVVSKSTMQSQKSMALFTADISQAAGVPLNMVMGDVAKMSGAAFSMMSKMPMAIIKSAVEARRLNTTINDIARASESILDFQNSVNAEMEASVLVGRAINLQRARELAYHGKIVESTREILDIAKRIDFQNLDFFQMQAFARATGRSVEELTKMLQAEKQISAARMSTDPAVQRQLQAYEKMKAYNEDMARESANNLETQLMHQANQERMVALQNKWNQLLMQASQVLLPILDVFVSIVGALISVGPLLSGAFMMFKGINSIVMSLAGKFVFFENVANVILRIMGPIKSLFVGISSMASIFGRVGSILVGFGKFVPVLGWIILAFQVISSAIKHIGSFLRGEISIGTALKNIVYDVLLKPFVDAWNWIKGIFVGRSPSELAMGIVKGLISVQTMMFNVLTYPFRKAWSWISGSPAPALFSATPQTPDASLSGGKEGEAAKAEAAAESPATKRLDDILSAIQTLNKNLETGKIGVYIDGQLMSATVARQTAFKGGFGMNVV